MRSVFVAALLVSLLPTFSAPASADQVPVMCVYDAIFEFGSHNPAIRLEATGRHDFQCTSPESGNHDFTPISITWYPANSADTHGKQYGRNMFQYVTFGTAELGRGSFNLWISTNLPALTNHEGQCIIETVRITYLTTRDSKNLPPHCRQDPSSDKIPLLTCKLQHTGSTD